MSEISVHVDHVFKRFRKGELFDSLRDLVPALTGKMFRRKNLDANDERDFWALEDVSFKIEKGEAFGIIGHNGAGKSTMLKILSRIMQPTKGSVTVKGRLSALIEVSAGFHHDLTGRENIFLNGTILGMSRREIESKFDAIVDFSGLEEFIDTPVKRYSSGMFARLGFSVAAHVDPEVLIVDEILSVGDFVFQQKCISRMNEIIKQKGTSVLFVSHNLRAVGDLCHRGLLLDHGRVSTIGPIGEVIDAYMSEIQNDDIDQGDNRTRISRVTMMSGEQECLQFDSNDEACIDIEVTGGEDCRRVAVVLYFTDENHYEFFNTSTERLGIVPYDLRPGDLLKCRFRLNLNIAPGTYHLRAMLYRYDTETIVDTWNPPKKFFIGSEKSGSKGLVVCDPEVVLSEVIGPGFQ